MSEIQAEEVKWLWYPYIPFGKITIERESPPSLSVSGCAPSAAYNSASTCFRSGMERMAPFLVVTR